MTIPQLEISTAPKSTANITNLTEDELKINPELYQMYHYYAPFAVSPVTPTQHALSPGNVGGKKSHLRSQSLPPQQSSPSLTPAVCHNNIITTPPRTKSNGPHYSFRTNMGPRRMNPNFLKPQLNAETNNSKKKKNKNKPSQVIHKYLFKYKYT